MIVLSSPTTARAVLRAVFIGAVLGLVLGTLVILALQNDFVQQKFLSLRYRVSEILPQPAQPQFAPTPRATLTDDRRPMTDAPTIQPPNHPTIQRPNHPTIQPSVALRGVKHAYQRWNNCGPATLTMNLSFYGKPDTQAQVAAFTKPNYDDRNVRPDELAAYANRAGLRAMIRVNGTLDRLKLLLSNGIPVIAETAFVKQPQGWMGHYRLLIGYDAKQFTTMDSYDGPNVKISFDALDAEWRAFNRLYLVIYSESQDALVRVLLADTLDDATMYAQAAARARDEIAADPQDAFAQFNLGSSLVGLKRYAQAAAAFDRARTLGLPWRMMWYEFGPYIAYLQTGRHDEVIALADTLLSKTDDLEESHYYKGLALRALKREPEARNEFETALKYNKNYRDAESQMTNQK